MIEMGAARIGLPARWRWSFYKAGDPWAGREVDGNWTCIGRDGEEVEEISLEEHQASQRGSACQSPTRCQCTRA